MDVKSVFNAAVCVIGIAILLVHTVNILLKKNRRKDENNLLIFVVFTIIHFSTYLTFTLIKPHYTSDTFIMSFYTVFYIMNNVESLLLFAYMLSFVPLSKKTRDISQIANIATFGIFVILDIINIFTHMFFRAESGVYVRADFMFFSQGYQLVIFAIVFVFTVFNKLLSRNERIAFAIYCLLPFVAIVVQNLLPGYAIAYLSIIISIEILFLFINVRKNMQLANEAKKSQEAEIKLMMSQIQPHFIYNTLASISTLIKIDPDKAQETLDNFTEYLRANLSSLSQTSLIPFENELRHIETYLALEKMRFDERLNVIYDIQTTDFMVPPLSVQPLVENSVKHGILKKIEGGTITIKTYENEEAYFVEISDNGVGFAVKNAKNLDNNHIGIENVRYRLTSMVNGDLKIESEIDKGTKVIVKFYK